MLNLHSPDCLQNTTVFSSVQAYYGPSVFCFSDLLKSLIAVVSIGGRTAPGDTLQGVTPD